MRFGRKDKPTPVAAENPGDNQEADIPKLAEIERVSQISLHCFNSKESKVSRKSTPSHRSSPATSSGSPLLRMPIEIRLEIFRYLLPSAEKKFKVYTDCDSSYTDRKWSVQRAEKPRSADPCTLAILRTNRLIYFEAMSILYSENAFHFIGSNFLPIVEFIRRLSPDSKALVRQLKITSKLHS